MYQKQPLVELLYGPFKRNRVDELPSGDRDWGFCLKTTRSNLLQDADIGKKRHWGSGGVEVATHPLQNQNSLGRPGRPPEVRKDRGERRKEENNLHEIYCMYRRNFCFKPLKSTKRSQYQKNRSLNDHVKVDFR